MCRTDIHICVAVYEPTSIALSHNMCSVGTSRCDGVFNQCNSCILDYIIK